MEPALAGERIREMLSSVIQYVSCARPSLAARVLYKSGINIRNKLKQKNNAVYQVPLFPMWLYVYLS